MRRYPSLLKLFAFALRVPRFCLSRQDCGRGWAQPSNITIRLLNHGWAGGFEGRRTEISEKANTRNEASAPSSRGDQRGGTERRRALGMYCFEDVACTLQRRPRSGPLKTSLHSAAASPLRASTRCTV